MRIDLIEDGQCYQTVEAASVQAAYDAHPVDPELYGLLTATTWIDRSARLAAREDCDGECADDGTCGACHPDELAETVTLDPEEPTCSSYDGHSWRDGQPRGHGGGVIYTDTCHHCGLRRTTDTWAQRRDTGEQGLVSTSYEHPDDPDLVEAFLGVR